MEFQSLTAVTERIRLGVVTAGRLVIGGVLVITALPIGAVAGAGIGSWHLTAVTLRAVREWV